MANANVDAEKLVFAADIICFFMKKHYPLAEFKLGTHIANVIDNYRPHVRQHFSEGLKKILDDIDDTQGFTVERDYSAMKHNNNVISLSSLKEYIDSFKKCNIEKRFSAGNFLLFCTRVSLMACFFFVSGTKSDLNYAINVIKDSFPNDEDDCRLLWNEIDNAAKNYGSNSQRNSASAVLGRKPSEHVDATSNETEDSNKSNNLTNATSSLFGREARESADVISSEAESSSRNNKQENAVADKEQSETADVISSGTEDSCSSSSTTNTESDSSANAQSMDSASSVESLNKLIMELNRMAKPRCENGAAATSNIAAATSNTAAASAVATSNKGCVKYVEDKQSTTTIAAAASSAESVKYVESKQSVTTAASSTKSEKYVQIMQTGTTAAVSGAETIKLAESTQSANEAVPAENLESNIQNPSVSSSTSSKIPKIEIDFKAKFEKAFMEVEAESSQKSPVKSPSKSCLGKRPSPRKEKVSFSKDSGSDDSETEIKKPKFRSPESKG